MVQSILVGVTALLTAALLPIYLIRPVEQEPEKPLLLIVQEAEQKQEQGQEETLRLLTESGVIPIGLEEYLTGVVISEMPASFEPEALKAQAVAARTFTLRQMSGDKHSDAQLCSDSGCCQAWTDQDALRDKLGSSWQQYWEKVSSAVKETEGEILTWNGQLIEAVYFSCSGGRTEAAAAVWGSEVPYLQPVDSPGEEQAAPYEQERCFSEENFVALIQKRAPDAKLKGNPAGWFGAVTKTAGEGVATMEIGGCSFTGTELRSLLELPSTRFTVSVTEEGIVFRTLGYGHRVGMSQYGANAMARQGSTYREILEHYYTGAKVERQ